MGKPERKPQVMSADIEAYKNSEEYSKPIEEIKDLFITEVGTMDVTAKGKRFFPIRVDKFISPKTGHKYSTGRIYANTAPQPGQYVSCTLSARKMEGRDKEIRSPWYEVQ